MFPDECENCGLETDELTDLEKPEGFLHWFICKHCQGKLYQHAFHPRPEFTDLCVTCGKTVNHDIHF